MLLRLPVLGNYPYRYLRLLDSLVELLLFCLQKIRRPRNQSVAFFFDFLSEKVSKSRTNIETASNVAKSHFEGRTSGSALHLNPNQKLEETSKEVPTYRLSPQCTRIELARSALPQI